MALQELDLTIVHRSGKQNTNANDLSQFPLSVATDDDLTCGVVTVMASSNTEEDDLPTLQRADEKLATIIEYLDTGMLPKYEKVVRQIALTRSLHSSR